MTGRKTRIEMLSDKLSEGDKEYKDEAAICAALLVKGCRDKAAINKLSKVKGKKFTLIWNRLKRSNYFDESGKIELGSDPDGETQEFITTMLLMVLVAKGFITRRLEK
jgi:hypothetical protein